MAEDLRNAKIVPADLVGKTIEDMPDHPSKIGMAADEIKEWFDKLPAQYLALTKYNQLIDILTATLAPFGAEQITAKAPLSGVATSVQNVLDILYSGFTASVPSQISTTPGQMTKVISDGDKVQLSFESTTPNTYVSFILDKDEAAISYSNVDGSIVFSMNEEGAFITDAAGKRPIVLDYGLEQFDMMPDFPESGTVNTVYYAKDTQAIYVWNAGIQDYEEVATVGLAATIEIDSTITGEPGTDAKVENVGNEREASFRFTIPRGEKGENGDGAIITQELATTTNLERRIAIDGIESLDELTDVIIWIRAKAIGQPISPTQEYARPTLFINDTLAADIDIQDAYWGGVPPTNIWVNTDEVYGVYYEADRQKFALINMKYAEAFFAAKQRIPGITAFEERRYSGQSQTDSVRHLYYAGSDDWVSLNLNDWFYGGVWQWAFLHPTAHPTTILNLPPEWMTQVDLYDVTLEVWGGALTQNRARSVQKISRHGDIQTWIRFFTGTHNPTAGTVSGTWTPWQKYGGGELPSDVMLQSVYDTGDAANTNAVDVSRMAAKTKGLLSMYNTGSGIKYFDGSSDVVVDFPTSLPPRGTAGGDLTGSYPNPSYGDVAAKTIMGNNTDVIGKPKPLTVEEAQELLGDGVYDRGENANGSWIRYVDGRMVCKVRKSFTLAFTYASPSFGGYYNTPGFVFPQPFTGTPTRYSLTPINSPLILSTYIESATSLMMYAISLISRDSATFSIDAEIEGRWK